MNIGRAARRPLLPLFRSYIRHFPVHRGKQTIWGLMGERLQFTPKAFAGTTLHGSRMTGHTRDLIDRFIYYLGVWEPNITDYILSALTSRDAFIDVGANTGYYSLLAAKACANVVAIEASPSIFGMLQYHLALNGAQNVRAVNIAASDREGEMTFYQGPADNRGRSGFYEVEGGRVECSVKTLPLDQILTDEEIQTARLIKIDVEGAEDLVLAGMDRILKTGSPSLEVIVEARENPVLERFRDRGFNAYAIPNSYDISDHIPPRPTVRPRRIDHITMQTDVVFSRRSVDCL